MTFEEFMNTLGYNINTKKDISIEWIVGGREGGNCWGDEARYDVDQEEEPEFEELDNILNKICPNITFLQYKKILSFIDKKVEEDYGWYGNYNLVAKKSLNLLTLYNYLKENVLR